MTKKITIISVSILFVIATIFISAAVFVYANGSHQYYFDKVEISSKYSVGDVFTVPECKMHFGSKQFDTSFKVVFPDGNECVKQSFVLEQKGNYKLIYQGEDVAEENTRLNVIDFYAASKLYEIVGNNDSVSPEYRQTDYNDRVGIVANIMEGNALRFNKTIDLSKLTKEEGVIEFFHVPTIIGYLDGSFKITLTDAYDEDNSVSILVRKYNEDSGDGWYNAYIMVSFNGGDEVGLRFNNNKNNDANSVYYNGAWHQLDRNNELGTCINYSMIGTPRNNVPLGGETLKFSYDYTEKIIYANGVFVSDLDDILFYKNTFKGFTTGEVFLSISGFNYSQTTINPVILSVAQMDVSKNILFDDQAPVIDVDTSSFDGQVIGAKNCKFKIFPATAIDKIDGNCDLSVKVYRNYYSSKIFVPVSNGEFLPDMNAKYYIEYSSADFSGNFSKKVVEVDILNKSNPLNFEVEGLNLTNVIAGESATLLSDIDVFGEIYGNKTDLKVIVKHLYSGEEYLLDDSFSFIAKCGGSYQLIIAVSDYVESVSKTYDFNVTSPDAPVFFGEPFVEKYYIKGAKYTADDFCAYIITDNAINQTATEVYLKEDDNAYRQINGEFTVNANNTIEFKYVAGESIYCTPKIKVVDVNFGKDLNLAGYFQGEVTSQTTKDYIKYTTENLIDGTTSFDFINSVKSENLMLTFGFNKNEANFEQFNVYITDAYDNANRIKLNFTSHQGKAAFSVNGGNKIVLSKDYLINDVLYNLNYNNTEKTIKIDNDAVISIEKNEAGQDFIGFVKYDVYVSFEFIGVLGNASVNIYELNGQTFNSNKYILPPVFTHVVSVGEIAVGQTFKINKIIVDDVLDPCVTVSDFYVTTPSGDYAYSVDGIKLDSSADYTQNYYVKAEEYGAYTIYLNAYNSSGMYSYLPVYEEVWVVDMVSPTITLKSDLPTIISVGSTVRLPNIEVDDDCSLPEDITLYTVVRFADGTFSAVKNQSFKADKKGEYTVMFVAYDQNGNTTIKTIVVYAQ